MTSPRDPFERLRAADPAKGLPFAGADDPYAQDLYEEIVKWSPGAPPIRDMRPQRRRMVAMVGAVLLMAAAYVVLRPVTEPLTVGCYQSPALESHIVVVPAPVSGDSVDVCVPLWESDGELGREMEGAPPPALQACVLDSGTVGVFPTASGSQVCADLGLAMPDPASQDANRVVVEMSDGLIATFLDRCVPLDEARLTAQEALSRHDLEGWEVVADQEFTVERPCASLAFDVPNKAIRLVPISP